MSVCEDKLPLLGALIDGELDAANAMALEAHLKTCAGCAEALADLESLHAALANPALREPAPAALRARIEADIGRSAKRPATGRAAWAGGGMLVGIAASLLLFLAAPQLSSGDLETQFIDGHVRSLQASHLLDVETSDRHTVKPWFNGKIDFAPPVVDLADQGFPLAGGRLDYIGGRQAAAIVFKRRLHTINLFVRPESKGVPATDLVARKDGYSVVRWTAGGLEFWAVSDIDPKELDQFHHLYAARAAG
jgi:anti-sigma factor RsiW